jgi:hypothetical protein
VAQDQGSKFVHVGVAMITSIKVRMPSLVNTMLTHRLEELNVFEGSTCSCFYPMWKVASYATVTKVSQTTSWVLVCSLP